MNSEIDIIIFTCEGREHLIDKTLSSFEKNAEELSYGKKILAIDGNYNLDSICFSPDLIIHSKQRLGYIHNILNGLKHINSEYFFWLEDDWNFIEEIDLAMLTSLMNNDKSIAQIVLNKKVVEPASHQLVLTDLPYGFSANPCLCRTETIKKAFESLLNADRGNQLGVDGFENKVSLFLKEKQLKAKLITNKQHISHSGYLESTDRKWHMTSSIEPKVNENYLGAMANINTSFASKFKMFLKMLTIAPVLIAGIFFSKKIYEFAFRIYHTFRNLEQK